MPTSGLVDLISEPLEDNETTEQEMNQGPDVESERSRGEVGLVLRVVGTVGILVASKGRVQVTREEEGIDNDVGNLGGPVLEADGNVKISGGG